LRSVVIEVEVVVLFGFEGYVGNPKRGATKTAEVSTDLACRLAPGQRCLSQVATSKW
jgi:hypothetical protein